MPVSTPRGQGPPTPRAGQNPERQWARLANSSGGVAELGVGEVIMTTRPDPLARLYTDLDPATATSESGRPALGDGNHQSGRAPTRATRSLADAVPGSRGGVRSEVHGGGDHENCADPIQEVVGARCRGRLLGKVGQLGARHRPDPPPRTTRGAVGSGRSGRRRRCRTTPRPLSRRAGRRLGGPLDQCRGRGRRHALPCNVGQPFSGRGETRGVGVCERRPSQVEPEWPQV